MAEVLAHTRKSLPRPTFGRIAAFFCVAMTSAFLTLAGWTMFIGQMAGVRDLKDAVITIIVQSGLVVMGPLVLWAYVVLMPRGLVTAIFRRLCRPFPP